MAPRKQPSLLMNFEELFKKGVQLFLPMSNNNQNVTSPRPSLYASPPILQEARQTPPQYITNNKHTSVSGPKE